MDKLSDWVVQGKIINEPLKYGGQHLVEELAVFIKIIQKNRVPEERPTSTTIPMFQKRDKKFPSNFRGINLLSTSLKLTTKIITNKINRVTSLADEQQGFRSGRSCTDAVFVIRQVTEKSIEYNKPAFICFVDLERALNRVQLKDVLYFLYNRQIRDYLIETIKDIYTENKIMVKTNGTNIYKMRSSSRRLFKPSVG